MPATAEVLCANTQIQELIDRDSVGNQGVFGAKISMASRVAAGVIFIHYVQTIPHESLIRGESHNFVIMSRFAEDVYHAYYPEGANL
jgi:precorrin-6x reductase